MSVSLMGCAHRSSIDTFLAPCVIEGKHESLKAVMADPNSATFDLVTFAGNAEDAVKACNGDKAAIKAIKGKSK